MHVLIIPSWYGEKKDDMRGVFFRDQALALKSIGIKVGIIYISVSSIGDSIKKRSIYRFHVCEEYGIPVIRSSIIGWLPKLKSKKSVVWKLLGMHTYRRYIKLFGKPDIMHAHSALYAGVIAQYIRKSTGIPYVVTEHSTAFSRNLFNAWEYKFIEQAFNHSSLNIAVSRNLINEIKERIPLVFSKWNVLPNIAGARFFLNTDCINKKPTHFTIINIASMVPRKNHRLLINALSEMTKNDNNISLLLIGDGPERPVLEKMVEEKGLAESIVFHGAVPPELVPSILETAHVLALSSNYETFGVVVIEALALGIPVVSTRCGGPEEIITSRKLGLLVAKDDAGSLAKALLEIKNNYGSYNSKEIRDHIEQTYGQHTIAHALEQLYAQLIASSDRE